MTFNYSYKPNPKIADIYNSLSGSTIPWSSMLKGPSLVAPVTRNLPNNSGSYIAPIVTPQNFVPKPVSTPQVQTPVYNEQTQPTQTATPQKSNIPPQYINPATGGLYSPQEFAEVMSKSVPNGDIGKFAGDTLTQGPQTTEQLSSTAAGLNNSRNDIATGTTDPYGAASKSGIAYSPAEMAAIEKAYAGVYDPAINTALAKLETKQKEDAAALESKNRLSEMAQKHQYDLELKRTPSGDTTGGLGVGGTAGGYVEGANHVVDSWVQRISRNEAKLSDITGVKNQALRDMVNMGLNTIKSRNAMSSGNLDTVNTLNQMLTNPKLDNISGFLGQSGSTSLFGEAKTAKVQYNQILGALQLAKAGQIKGQGQISDYERSVLKEAAAAIDRGMSDEEFRKALVKLRGVMMTSSGLEAPVKIIDPTTQEFDYQSLTTEEINKFIMDGAIVEYVE